MSDMHFTPIDASALFEANKHLAQWWRKTAQITARPAIAGEGVVTTIGGLTETTNTAAPGDMLVRNPAGELYLVKAQTFQERYNPVAGEPDANGFKNFAAKGQPMPCLLLDRNVAFTAPWGEAMKIPAGGVLVSNGPGDVYGIHPAVFRATYSRCTRDGAPVGDPMDRLDRDPDSATRFLNEFPFADVLAEQDTALQQSLLQLTRLCEAHLLERFSPGAVGA